MGISVFPVPSAASKTPKVEVITSGSSWTVPANVSYVNVLVVGGGGGSPGILAGESGTGHGYPGHSRRSTVTTTPGASIAVSIGAGGTRGTSASGSAGGASWFTGATTASGGNGGSRNIDAATASVTIANNGAYIAVNDSNANRKEGGNGGNGWIEIEYWV